MLISNCFLKQSPWGKKSQVLLWSMSQTRVSWPSFSSSSIIYCRKKRKWARLSSFSTWVSNPCRTQYRSLAATMTREIFRLKFKGTKSINLFIFLRCCNNDTSFGVRHNRHLCTYRNKVYLNKLSYFAKVRMLRITSWLLSHKNHKFYFLSLLYDTDHITI